MENSNFVIHFTDRKKKIAFAAGGDWNMVDKTEKTSLVKIAKKNNAEHFDNRYAGVAVELTPDINDYRAYGFFSEFPKGAHSLAMLFAVSNIGRQTVDSGNIQKPVVRFFHLRDEMGKEVVWIVVITDDIIQEDRVVESMDSFNAENAIRSEYGDIDFVEYEVDDGQKALEEIWRGLSKKERERTRIVSFASYKKRIIAIAVALALIGGLSFAGATWYLTKLDEEKRVQEKMRQEAEASRKINALKKSEFPPVWLSQPEPSEILNFINRTLAATPTVVNGWVYGGLDYKANEKSGDGAVKIAYTRRNTDPYLPPPGKIDAKKPNQCIVQSAVKFPKSERRPGIMKLKNAETWILQASQGQPYKVVYRLQARQTKTVQVGSTPVQVTAAYQVFDLKIDNVKVLSGLARRLDAPGLVINSVRNVKGNWNIQAKLYVLP